jgi:hypothetical protein
MKSVFGGVKKALQGLEQTVDDLESTYEEIMRSRKGKKTKVRIKAGSTVVINGATCRMLESVVVETDKPKTLMKID